MVRGLRIHFCIARILACARTQRQLTGVAPSELSDHLQGKEFRGGDVGVGVDGMARTGLCAAWFDAIKWRGNGRRGMALAPAPPVAHQTPESLLRRGAAAGLLIGTYHGG